MLNIEKKDQGIYRSKTSSMWMQTLVRIPPRHAHMDETRGQQNHIKTKGGVENGYAGALSI
jgi:hypothetical protein